MSRWPEGLCCSEGAIFEDYLKGRIFEEGSLLLWNHLLLLINTISNHTNLRHQRYNHNNHHAHLHHHAHHTDEVHLMRVLSSRATLITTIIVTTTITTCDPLKQSDSLPDLVPLCSKPLDLPLKVHPGQMMMIVRSSYLSHHQNWHHHPS